MTIEKTQNGYLIYTMHNGYLLQHLYIGYTKAESLKLFKKLLKQK